MSEQERLTPERLSELRRIAEAAVPGKWSEQDFQLAMTPRTTLALLDRIETLEQERDAARAEAERWRQRYEALRAGVERVVQDLHERAHAAARDWQQSGHPYHDGASDAYYEAEQMVWRVLG